MPAGKFNIPIEILVDDYDNLKSVMVHELAHVVVTRLAAQKWHMWKMHGGLVPNIGEDTDPHGPIFQWAYELMIKRVEKIDDMVAEKCWDDLYDYQHPEIIEKFGEET